jgi:hypothetical protein
VALDGTTVPDSETGQPRPTIVVRMPAFVAEHLAALLVAWSQLGKIVVDAVSGGETETASTLLVAARVGRRQDDGGPPADLPDGQRGTARAGGRQRDHLVGRPQTTHDRHHKIV